MPGSDALPGPAAARGSEAASSPASSEGAAGSSSSAAGANSGANSVALESLSSLPARDLEQMAALTRACGLPALADRPQAAAAIARDGEGLPIGFGSCERHGDHAVLARIAVCPRSRGAGVGGSLMDSILRQLIATGVQSVALLAIGGQDFFSRFGFNKVDAADLPPALRESGQFDRADPVLASPMRLDLRGATLVRPARRDDMPAVLAIYNDAVAQTTATYDYDPRPLEAQLAQYDQKMLEGYGFHVAVTPDGTVAGFSTYGLYRPRPGWRFACEHSVYVAAPWRGRGVGLSLLPPIMCHARKRGFHTMIGVVDADNAASLRMHRRAGFVEVGTVREGGYKFDRWLDVAFLQAML
jgi:L-amino acid N-acyltransferase YncA